MSGDVQPRKRKEKRRKKEDSDEIPTNFSSDEQLHVHKDASTGGNICAKILFFLLSFVLLVMIGLVVFEYRGTADDEALVPVSKWAATFEGWLETPVKHDEHADITESGEEEHGDNLGRSDEVTVKQQKIPGVLEKKIKAVSEEEADVPRRKQEKQVSETTQPVEGTSTVTVGQKSHDQHKSEDPGQVKLKAHQSAVKQKVVTEKPVVSKPEKPEGHHDQDLSASKSKHQTRSTEHRAMKNDGFPSGPGGSGQGHKAEDVSASNVMPSKKPKVDAETTKDGPSAATLPKKQKDNTGPALKNEQLPTNPSKPTISGGKNFKDKDSPSDGVHSPPKASRTGDKVETSQKGGKSGTLHSVKEQSSPTKLDGKDKVPVSKSPHVDRSTEEHKKTVERKDKHESKSVPSAPASGAKNSKLDTKDAQMTVEDTVKISDLKTNANDKVQAAGNSASKVKRASNDREKDSVEVEPVMKEAGNLNSKAKEVRDGQSGAKNKLGEKKVEKLQKNEGHSSNERKENKEQITPKLDRHSETVKGVAGKDPSASKVHEDRTRSKVDVEKQKVHSPDSAKVSGDGSSGVPVKVSTDQARKASADNTKSRTPEKSADANAPKKKNVKNNTPVEDTHHSKPRDAKASAIPETTLKHSVADEIKVSKTSKDKTVEEEEEEDEPEPSGVPKARKLQREEDDESGSDKEIPASKSKIPKNMGGQNAQVYSKAEITNEDDWHIIQDLDRADDDAEENPEVAIHRYDTILKSYPNSPRAWYGKATALDQLAAKKKSNFILDQAIDAYKKVTSGPSNVQDKLFILATERCIDRMRFRGVHASAVPVHKLLIARFPDDPSYQNQLAVTLLMINRTPEAKQVLENVLQKWPSNGFAQVHYGFILKTGNYNMTEAVKYLQEGIATREPGTIDGRFFFQLGDALMRLGRRKEAMEVNELGVREGLFLSKYQRSLYNVDRLHAQPWWTPEETTYAPYFRKLEENWKQIKDEGVKALYDKNKNLFRDEAENLKDSGKWKQLELFARGRKVQANCAKAPVTCKLIEDFPAARDCRRGQVKFSVMDPGTHVWPHCGPTNCRLRAHLGLVVPKNTFIRVAEETRTWEEGKLFIFDDSFEHEVWHNGTTTRLVLIVDVWHPELTMEEKRTLPAI